MTAWSWAAAICFPLLYIVQIIAQHSRTRLYICPTCGLSSFPTTTGFPWTFPTHCANGHRMKGLFPGTLYALVVLVGDVSGCVLVAHFVTQRFLPSATPIVVVFAVWGTFSSLQEAFRIPSLVSQNPQLVGKHLQRVKSHYWGAFAGHTIAIGVLVWLDLRAV